MGHDSSRDAQGDGAILPSTPAMPSVSSSDVYPGQPWLLVESGVRHAIGWRDDRKGGPSFVVARTGFRVKVIETFPLSETGWASAWQALVQRDPGAAESIAPVLAERAARRRAVDEEAMLDAQTLRLMRLVTYKGGSEDSLIAKDQLCNLRFLRDRTMVCVSASAEVLLEVPHRDMECVNVSGPTPTTSGAPAFALALILGLLGGLTGLFIRGLPFSHGWPALLFGAVIGVAAGASVGSGWNKVESIVHLRTRDADYFFMDTHMDPDALRIVLSGVMRAIEKAQASQGSGQP
ncbi:MAG: hypothetical protein LBV34_12585 [Nocardiopsaceae bacterium]|nr:hypothetical protein [Nocardiopsaceae bacterium]